MTKHPYVLWLLLLGILFHPRVADASPDPVMGYILEADSVHTASGGEGLAGWVPTQPDLAGAAAARLIDIGVEVGDAGNAGGEAENVALVEALARAAGPNSAVATLLAEYRAWDADARRERARARAIEEDAWANVGAAPDSALAMFQSADGVYENIGDSHSRARIFGRMGAACWYLGDADGVQSNYEQALHRRRAVGDRMLEGATLNGTGSFHYLFLGDLEAALGWYDQAIEVRREIGDIAGLATSLTYKANVLRDLGRLVEARELFEEARPVLEELGDVKALVENLYGTGLLYQTTGRSTDAAATYSEGIALCEASPDCAYLVLLQVEKAVAQTSLGLIREGLASLDRAEAALGSNPDASLATLVWMVRAHASRALGDEDAARDQLLRARQSAQASGDIALQCDTATQISELYFDLGAMDRALGAAEDALELARELGDPALESAALTAAARVQVRRGDAVTAHDAYKRALAIDESVGDAARVANDLLGSGAALSLQGKSEEARADLRRAVRIMEDSGQETRLWRAYLNIADSFEKSDPDSAAYYYDQALASLERGNRSFGGEGLNTGYLFAQRGRAYEEITRYYASRHLADPKADRKRVRTGNWAAKAFETAERSRARGLLELLNDSFALDAGPEALTLIDSLYQLDTATDRGRAERERIESRLASLRAERRAGTAGTAIDPVGLLEFRKQKPTQALVLQFAVGDSATILFAIDNKATVLFELPGRAELRRRVTAFRDAIAQPGVADEALLREGRELYRILLEPVELRVARRKHLVIVPDDILFELPFEALLTADPVEGAAWKEQPFFARSHRPTYAPSSTVYLQLREQKTGKFQQSLLALGDVDYSSLDRSLEPLPFTRQEVEGIPHKLKDPDRTLLLGDEATEARFRVAMSLISTRVVHLATHGLIDPAEAMRSNVVLGPEGDDDGYLHALEILTMQLDRPMIVLSACESALGRLERGEGVVGLTRSFLAAGARGVVASLWPVNDESTAQLMSEFYYALWKKYSASESLRQARLAMLEHEDWGHPYYWAPFIVIGTEKTPW